MRDPTFSRHVQAKNRRVEELSSGESEWESSDGSLLPPSSFPPPPSLPPSLPLPLLSRSGRPSQTPIPEHLPSFPPRFASPRRVATAPRGAAAAHLGPAACR